MRRIAAALLVLNDPDEAPASAVVTALQEIGVPLHRAAERSFAEDLQRHIDDGQAPASILVAPDVIHVVQVARHVHRAVPMTQLVILADDARAETVRQAMAMAPMVGNHWSVADPAGPKLAQELLDAVRATRQRSSLRTTLDRMNLQIRDRAGPESDVYRKLVISDRHLASILEHAEEAIASVDSADTIATWNQGAARMFGYEAQDAVGRPVDLLTDENEAGELRTALRAARAGRPVRGQEMACRRRDGSVLYVEWTVAPVRDDEGGTVSVSIIARDVTDRLRQEARIRDLNRELKRRVQDLASANSALKRALEMLEAKKRELIAANAELELKATTDALTGLKNRIVFQNSLIEMIALAARQSVPLSVLLIDVDHFKRVNDERGHQEGDRVLQAIAAALSTHTREQDIVARYGGEEFSVLLPNTAADPALAVAENLRVGCRKAVPDIDPELTVSVGVATYIEGDDGVTLVRRADQALYASKERGRNCVTHADEVVRGRRSAG